MKLSPEDLIDWFLTANPRFPAEFRHRWLAELKAPSEGTRSEMISGMKQGINDTLTKAQWWSDAQRKNIDDLLVVKGLLSLRKMEAVLKKKHLRILSRGLIKNEEEYYIVAEVVSDLRIPLSEDERRKLGQFMAAYESKIAEA